MKPKHIDISVDSNLSYNKLNDNSNNNVVDDDTTNIVYEYKKMDRGAFAWLVCFATAWCFGVNGGMATNFPLLYNKLVQVYNETDHYEIYTASAGSTEFGVESFFYLPSSMLIYMIDMRIVSVTGAVLSTIGLLLSAVIGNIKYYILTYGIVFGIGQALLKQATYVVLPHYFRDRLGLANGLMNLGGSLFSLTLILLSAQVLRSATLFYGFMFLCLLSATTIVLAFTFKPTIKRVKKNGEKVPFLKQVKNSMGIEIFKKKKFIVWCVSSFFGLYGAVIPIFTMDHHATSLFPKYSPEFINFAFTVSAGVSGLLFGKLIDLKTIGYLIWGVAQALLYHAPSFPLLILNYILFAVGDGAFFTSIVPVSCEVADSPFLASQANAYFHVFVALPQMIGPVVAAYLFNHFKSYQYSFYMGSAFCFLCAFIQLCFYPDGLFYILLNKFNKWLFPKNVVDEKTCLINE